MLWQNLHAWLVSSGGIANSAAIWNLPVCAIMGSSISSGNNNSRDCEGKKEGNEMIWRLDAEKVFHAVKTEWKSFELVVQSGLGEIPIMAAIPNKDALYIFCGDRGYMVDVNLMQANKCHDHD